VGQSDRKPAFGRREPEDHEDGEDGEGGACPADLRALLVRLSGRQLEWGQEHTTPALLAGLWVLLAMLEALDRHSLEELRHFQEILLGVAEEDSG
jgi:hypothetical protein